MDDLPKSYRVKEVRQANANTTTLAFEGELKEANPGQFVMLWLPEVSERPVSVHFANQNEFWLSVSAVGSWSEAIQKVKAGDKLGIRGPYGTFFQQNKAKKIALVGGGFGTFPLYFFATQAIPNGAEIDFIVGARNKDLLLCLEEDKETGAEMHPCTDDGSTGFKGFTTEKLKEVLAQKEIDLILTCGPEKMMAAVAEIGAEKNISVQLSLERFIKCGFGVCGSCAVDDEGLRMCVEGPILEAERARQWPEFGKYYRDSGGSKKEW